MAQDFIEMRFTRYTRRTTLRRERSLAQHRGIYETDGMILESGNLLNLLDMGIPIVH